MFNLFKKQKSLKEKATEAMNTKDIYGRFPSFIILNEKGEIEGMYGDKLTFKTDGAMPACHSVCQSESIIAASYFIINDKNIVQDIIREAMTPPSEEAIKENERCSETVRRLRQNE
uniref:Uncharacterized protein n=1 Tax=viral metagenome TaxID=1070528 RepID=A0A6M3XGE7_9ZZZZ